MAQVKVVRAVAFDHGSWDPDEGLAETVLRVQGEFPAHALPFVVDRVYQGPQGVYEETFAVVGADDRFIWGRDYQVVELRGEMFEDRFTDVVPAGTALLQGPQQHHIVLLVDGYEVGRVPIEVEAPQSARAMGVSDDAIGRALAKSAIVWLGIPQPNGTTVVRPAWFVYHQGIVYALTGPDEQDLPNIALADKVTITARSVDVRAQIGEVPSRVRVVRNDSDEFDQVAQLGLGTRLNLKDGEAALERWRANCTMVALIPTG